MGSGGNDEEAKEDLSLKIVQKSVLRACINKPRDDGISANITDVKMDEKEEEKKKMKSTEIEAPEDAEDNVKGEEKLQTSKAAEFSDKSVETNPVEVPVNAVLRKLLRGPRYFDLPDNSWGACYNCGEEGHSTANCTEARRKKPCFVCGSFEHNAKLCSKGRDCFICKQHGHRAKNCPVMNKNSKICLKCGDVGHDLFSCRNDYFPDDLKEMQCYICQRYGHLCCMDYDGLSPIELSCYICGLSGHTGLACTGCRGDTSDTVSANSCYRCGGEGHFARECTMSLKPSTRFRGDINGTAGKRNREPSTPKQRSSRKNRKDMQVKSAPHDLSKSRKKKKSQHGEFSSAVKPKHRGGWMTEHPGDLYGSKHSANNWRSPVTPTNRRSNISGSYRDHASSSHSPKNPRKLNFNNSASSGSSRFYQHRYSASRFDNSGNDGIRRNYNW
ncbi:hypothetical protein ACJIZ3_017442 [Penstemon smallii]|uniref:CCHC-type domain-containing protein n=1 Tax=Penstemon smallii TaxID=265156 RepID=A0ABD3SWC1_9LAMI